MYASRAAMKTLTYVLIALSASCPVSTSAGQDQSTQTPTSAGTYRLPYADGTVVKVFDDFGTHRPKAALDLFAVDGPKPYRIVAAAAGRIMAIQDAYGERQSGRPAAECHNNYVWIAHANGEWTNYSHVAQGSVTQGAKLKVGDVVAAGAYLGDEASVGCAMLNHLHFEVAVPLEKTPIDGGGFLLDNDNSKRERNPGFCLVPGSLIKGRIYTAAAC